jgi:glutathione peroxidase-family protein
LCKGNKGAAVACFCGFTKQYPGFQELQKKFGDKFTVIAFPCNQFGGQEPGTPAQIKEFIKQFGENNNRCTTCEAESRSEN